MSEVTQILQAIESGDRLAANRLLPLVYDELRRLAATHLAHEGPGQTLQPTALVHEAYLRLVGKSNPEQWNSRGHFFGAAAIAIRRILVENARRKKSLKRGGDLARHTIDGDFEPVSAEPREDLLALNEALDRLSDRHSQAADLVQLVYFAGLTQQEAGEALGIGERTARRHWSFARAWLRREMQGLADDDNSENS